METATHHPDHDNLVVSCMLLIFGWILKEISTLQIGEIFSYLLQFFSLVSVSMIIIINWEKFGEALRKIFKKK